MALFLSLTRDALKFLSLKRDEATVFLVLAVRVVLRGSLPAVLVFLFGLTLLLAVVDFLVVVLDLLLTTLL